jgi:hypothetical protein
MFKLRIADCGLRIAVAFAAATIAIAQESPTPTASPEESASASPAPTPTVSSSAAPARNVPLRFVPPPMEGTISLGIWDSNDKLVRVLHREAKIDIFTIDENALKTTWDGKNDAGEDLPAGKYRARGYLVGKIKIEPLPDTKEMPTDATDHVFVKLVVNPLVSDTRSNMEISLGLDTNGCFVKTMDGLPLITVTEKPADAPNAWSKIVKKASLTKPSERVIEIWEDGEEAGVLHTRVSNIDKMMAFDCGFFELK